MNRSSATRRLGLYGVMACQMGVLSLRSRKYMRWDKERERAVEA